MQQKQYILLFTIFIIQFSFGQIATIKDVDGYTNIRENPSKQSDIIHKILIGDLFWYDYIAVKENNQWIPIYIPVENSSTELKGFIHKSRVLILDEAENYSEDHFYFHYHLSSFDSTNREITMYQGKFITKIDGKIPLGTDDNIPKIQIDSIDVKIDENSFSIDKEHFENIFEATNKFKVIKTGDFFIVYQNNSDGAGGYSITWVFDKNGFIKKFAGSMI